MIVSSERSTRTSLLSPAYLFSYYPSGGNINAVFGNYSYSSTSVTVPFTSVSVSSLTSSSFGGYWKDVAPSHVFDYEPVSTVAVPLTSVLYPLFPPSYGGTWKPVLAPFSYPFPYPPFSGGCWNEVLDVPFVSFYPSSSGGCWKEVFPLASAPFLRVVYS